MKKREKEQATGKATKLYNELSEISKLIGNPFIGWCCYPKIEENRNACEYLLRELKAISKLLKIKLNIRISTKDRY